MRLPTDNINMRIKAIVNRTSSESRSQTCLDYAESRQRKTIVKAYDGRWMIVSAIAFALLLFGTKAHAQIVSSNPLEYVALAEGNDLINGQIKHQIEDQQKTALLQNTIAAEFTQIHKWEKKYNSYLKTASGYASTLKACTSLYLFSALFCSKNQTVIRIRGLRVQEL